MVNVDGTGVMTRCRKGLAVCCLGLLLLAGTAAAQANEERVVARVNGDSITVSRFNASYVQHLIRTGRNDTPRQRYAHLDNLIDTYLLAGEARRRGMEDAAYDRYMERQIKKAVGGRFFEVAFLDSLPELTDAEIREAFRRGQEKVAVRHLFYTNPEDAAAAYARLEAGEDFLALANECFETAVFDSAAGYLGVAGYWDLDDAFAETAFALPVGSYSEPVRTRYGWHIVRVEDRIYNPLLTESEYQYRREGVHSKARERRVRLQGDRFVRSLMNGLGVVVDRDGMQALRDVVQRVMGAAPADPQTPPPVSVGDEEVAAIRDELTPETVLATYVLDGEPQAFTARDYVAWLEELPYGEVRNRTAASVGRALRNEVLALKGFARGLDRDARVLEDVHFLAADYLAAGLRTHLRTNETVTPSEQEAREAFDRLGYRTLKEATADFWRIPFASLAEAEAAKRAIAADSLRPADFEAYAAYEAEPLDSLGALGPHIQRAPLQVPVIIGTAEGAWFVAEVEDRTLVYTTFEEVRPQIERVLSTYLPEIQLLKDLRRQATIEVDEELFEQMMKLDGSV